MNLIEKEKFEKEEKAFLKREKKKEGYDENNPPQYIPPTKKLRINSTASSMMDVNKELKIFFNEPLMQADDSYVHLSRVEQDTLFFPIPFVMEQTKLREYVVYAEWRPGEKYYLTIDSAAFKGFYGGVSEKYEQLMEYRPLDDYAVLYLNIPGTGDNAVVELLDSNGAPAASERTQGGSCAFYFIKPGKYSLRLFMDANNNGKWDTGSYADGLQPEELYYYPQLLNLRALFEYQLDDWNIALPLDKQKPLEITKQKPEEKKRKTNRNATRKF